MKTLHLPEKLNYIYFFSAVWSLIFPPLCIFFKLWFWWAAVECGTKDWRKTVHNLTQTMSSAQIYSGPWSHQDTPSILMLFMREQRQLSERICVKMVRAAWRHSSLQALHLCIEARLSAVAMSAVHKLHKEGSRLVSPHTNIKPPHHPWCASGWVSISMMMTNPGRWQVWAGAWTNGWVGLVAFSTSSQVPLLMREWRLV